MTQETWVQYALSDVSSNVCQALNHGELPREMKDELTENIKFRINENEHRLTGSEPKWIGNVFFSTVRFDLRSLVFGDGEPEAGPTPLVPVLLACRVPVYLYTFAASSSLARPLVR